MLRIKKTTRIKKQPLNTGYTLIELLLYVAILGILTTAMGTFFVTIVELRVKNQSIAEVDQQAAFAMEYITQTIRNSTSVTSPTKGSGTATSTTLVVPTGSLSPTVFDLSGGILRVKEGTGSPIALTNGKVQVSSLSFNNNGTNDDILQISFVVSRLDGVKNEYTFQKTFISTAEVRP